MSRPRVLVVDDEPQILRFLKPALEAADFEPITAATAAEAIRLAATAAPDIAIIDLGLPDRDGKDVIREIRAWSQMPIIVLSARDRESEKIAALDLGADDYINKPFGVGEMMARIRANLRHRQHAAAPASIYRSRRVLIDAAKHRVEIDGTPVHLTPKEFELLSLIVNHAGRVLTHRQILTAIWGPAHGEDLQYLRVFIRQLRNKIEKDPTDPTLILTEPGIGYRFSDEADAGRE